MIQGLVVLTGAIPGIRDLNWVDDPDPAVQGYDIYRSEDATGQWAKLNPYLWPGSTYRDQTRLDQATYTFTAADWFQYGEEGSYILKVPDAPLYGLIDSGRAIVASRPSEVQLQVNGVAYPVARVDGAQGFIWLAREARPVQDGNRTVYVVQPPLKTDTITISYLKLGNFVPPTPASRCFYTVVPTKNNNPMWLPGAPGTPVVSIMEVESLNYMMKRAAQYNGWLFEFAGEPAHLMFRRTKGVSCGCKAEGGVARTGCRVCYETGIIGGYYGPVDIFFIDPDTAATTTTKEGGREVTRVSKSYLGPTPLVHTGDLIFRKNGERLVIANPTYKSPQGALAQQEFDVQLLQPGDTRYSIPFRDPGHFPSVFNPAFDSGEEPVSQPKTDPTKVWEADTVPVGRTEVWGNIQT